LRCSAGSLRRINDRETKMLALAVFHDFLRNVRWRGRGIDQCDITERIEQECSQTLWFNRLIAHKIHDVDAIAVVRAACEGLRCGAWRRSGRHALISDQDTER